jgi:hypothetical protein
VLLVSGLPPETIAASYAEYAADLGAALNAAGVPLGAAVPVLLRAGEAIVEPA